MRSAGVAILALGLLSAAAPLAAQQELSRAFELERRGNHRQAVEAFRVALRARPADPSALLGLERSLAALGRQGEVVPDAVAALAATPRVPALYGVAVRGWAAAGRADSARAYAERWTALEPADETPFRELGSALLLQRDRAGARAAWLAGRERAGRPDAHAAELAQLAAGDGDYGTATREWLAAIRKLAGYRSPALTALRQAPEPQRPPILAALGDDGSPEARRMEAELRARWGDPVGGFERLAQALPADDARAADALRTFAEGLRGQAAPPARLALGCTLEALAQRLRGPQAARTRLDAAQAFLDGGDRPAARRMLDGLAREGSGTLAATASATLLRLLIEEGRVEEAERQLAELGAALSSEERDAVARRIALAHARAGRLERAEALAQRDSSVQGLALQGQLRLFRGDVAGAVERLRAAGPYAGTREEATARTQLLALLVPLDGEPNPALGAAFLALERSDSAAAVAGFTRVSAALAPAKGGAELTLLAGRIEAARGRAAEAERLLRAAAVPEASGAAPQALLELGRLLERQGRATDAVAAYERVILEFPGSIVVPQARRALDVAKGAVPN